MSALAVKSKRLQQVPALKQELEEKDDLIAALAEQWLQLVRARRVPPAVVMRSSRVSTLSLIFCISLAQVFGLIPYNLTP